MAYEVSENFIESMSLKYETYIVEFSASCVEMARNLKMKLGP